VNYEHLPRSQYFVEITRGGAELPIEFINHYWHILRWDEEWGAYITKNSWRLPRGEYGTGYYHITQPEHPEYRHPSPLELRITSDQESTPTTQSPQD
jgi:hypothetical protein